MGKFNSSELRVVPLMNEIKKNPKILNSIMDKLTNGKIKALQPPMEFYYGSGKDGHGEKRLRPTKLHLMKLVMYFAGCERPTTLKKREDLFGLNGPDKQDEAVSEALRLIEEFYQTGKPTVPREWYIFEGNTAPDFYIEGEDYIVVGEGKWTEGDITLTTTHLKGEEQRCQMIRHIQATLNETRLKGNNKKVYAFYIVEKGCAYESKLTKKALAEQIKNETIDIPLVEQKMILESFYGYTTWEDIEDLNLGIHFKTP